MRRVRLQCGSRLMVSGNPPTMARTRRSSSPSMSGKLSATAAPCRSRYTPSSGAASSASDSRAQISAEMRSERLVLHRPRRVGEGPGQRHQRRRAPGFDGPAMGTEVPRTAENSASPETSPGNPPGVTKSA